MHVENSLFTFWQKKILKEYKTRVLEECETTWSFLQTFSMNTSVQLLGKILLWPLRIANVISKEWGKIMFWKSTSGREWQTTTVITRTFWLYCKQHFAGIIKGKFIFTLCISEIINHHNRWSRRNSFNICFPRLLAQHSETLHCLTKTHKVL